MAKIKYTVDLEFDTSDDLDDKVVRMIECSEGKVGECLKRALRGYNDRISEDLERIAYRDRFETVERKVESIYGMCRNMSLLAMVGKRAGLMDRSKNIVIATRSVLKGLGELRELGVDTDWGLEGEEVGEKFKIDCEKAVDYILECYDGTEVGEVLGINRKEDRSLIGINDTVKEVKLEKMVEKIETHNSSLSGVFKTLGNSGTEEGSKIEKDLEIVEGSEVEVEDDVFAAAALFLGL
jgi:hypothetical protein